MSRPLVPPVENRFLRRTRNEQVRKSRRARSLLRSASWMGLHLAVLALVVLAAWSGHHYLTHSERFTVRRMLVQGSGYAPERQIRVVTDRYLGRNIFTADLEALQSGLEAAPWIRTVHA
ncbi:MAG TPA: FtsQ-type POTRA domain-containing protein, partial [Candidatus Polarisedimenticolia bacterium]|nr:FtsQ-type POTRA domain-containing protein [Candidatus Polarisedimenticolia bacterium]